VVRQQLVYVNLSLPMPVIDYDHSDAPAFRGINRREFPIWLLCVVDHSRLFESWRIRVATAVPRWFESEAGESTYWPDGPTRRPDAQRAQRAFKSPRAFQVATGTAITHSPVATRRKVRFTDTSGRAC